MHSGPQSHPVVYHLLDVAAATRVILRARPLVARRLGALLHLDGDSLETIVVTLAALHDIGKFAPAFQAKAKEHWPTAALGPYSEHYCVRQAHTEDGIILWDEMLGVSAGRRLWTNANTTLDFLAPAVFGHHGRPVGSFGQATFRRFRGRTECALAAADAVVALLAPHPVNADAPTEADARLASWLLSGLLTAADWIGSNQHWFPYTDPLADDHTLSEYWSLARARAERAVFAAGLTVSTPAGLQSFAHVTRVDGPPTPTQQWASEVPLPDGPALFVIEDVTGAGKTEAAQMLVHRLMARGSATGAYWAMPTMATANAMYTRQSKYICALYAPAENDRSPSLILSHGQQRLHEGFRATVLGRDGSARVSSTTPRDMDGGNDLESSIACAAFLADDRRAALLADVGVGTVDQAILGVLPSRFNTVRLFGLAGKTLVIDEAHAYDAYMSVEIAELLRFHAALGGSAVVLSATLTMRKREELARAWREGVAGGQRKIGSQDGCASEAYPLATVVVADGVREEKLAPAPWSKRRVAVRLVHTADDALEHVIAAQARGAAVAWVRNTVDDCIRAAEALRARGIEPVVFHARFAQGDRQTREREVMKIFGKEASPEARRGRVIVATQVIEQSLDLDFDAMVSDVAPIDLLVQRAGRLWRHESRTLAGRSEGSVCELVVLAPEVTDDPPKDWLTGVFAGTAHVYAHTGVLWRTVRALSEIGAIEAPDGLRLLIERVYAPMEDEPEPVPESLLESTHRAEATQGADAAAANYGVRKPPDGYQAGAVAWVDDMRMPTRLGEERTTIRLSRVDEATAALIPWFTSLDGVLWKSWALSEVSVSSRRVPADTRADPLYASAVERVRGTWGRFEQDVPVLVLSPGAEGSWMGLMERTDGRMLQFGYSTANGLRV